MTLLCNKTESALKPRPTNSHKLSNTAATMAKSDSEGAAIVKEIWAHAAKQKASEKRRAAICNGHIPPLLNPLDQPLDFETTPESNPLVGPGSAQLARNPRHWVPKPL
ncbi:hypothetical protein PCASD_22475 [Puccinia coronata f. sp. avenae]|uniref:Uncharacterized protein n=1 Tax=Puccinia coronata f. sp. avenae TaxID=200324 RepID=A0A2N5S6F8_9BASI|nr:hypothetical protein PCASD_22475 [Puccinia coronata f. sp. avenae]